MIGDGVGHGSQTAQGTEAVGLAFGGLGGLSDFAPAHPVHCLSGQFDDAEPVGDQLDVGQVSGESLAIPRARVGTAQASSGALRQWRSSHLIT